jgi:hypothetical protein
MKGNPFSHTPLTKPIFTHATNQTHFHTRHKPNPFSHTPLTKPKCKLEIIFPSEIRDWSHRRQPVQGRKPKMKARRLRSGVNWQGTLNKKGVKQKEIKRGVGVLALSFWPRHGIVHVCKGKVRPITGHESPEV